MDRQGARACCGPRCTKSATGSGPPAHSINVLHFLPASIKSDGDTILKNLADAIAAGKRNPPPPIIAIPAGERLAGGLIR